MLGSDHLPRIEDFRSDYTPAQTQEAEALNTRAIAMQAYLQAFPAFLHMRQLTEFIQGRVYYAPNECPLGGWVLMRQLATPETTTVSPNVDTLYGASYLLLDKQGPVVLSIPPIPGRYYSVAILDAYFNNFAIVSPRTFGNDGGEYLLAPQGGMGAHPKASKQCLSRRRHRSAFYSASSRATNPNMLCCTRYRMPFVLRHSTAGEHLTQAFPSSTCPRTLSRACAWSAIRWNTSSS